MEIINQAQDFEGYKYAICDLIEASKDIKRERVPIRFMNVESYGQPCTNDLMDFSKHCKRVQEADLSCPIILSPGGFILDGKHRLCKTLILGYDDILAVQFKEMPYCGMKIA